MTLMTLTPMGLKGKQQTPEGLSIPTDWCVCTIDQPTSDLLNKLRLPFKTILEPKDTVPAEFSGGVCHLVGGQTTKIKGGTTLTAPFTSDYALFNGALLAIFNVNRVWFKIHLRENNIYKCHCLAQPSLCLKDHPLDGINYERLKAYSTLIT